MRDYGKVYSTFWSSATTSGMSDDGKVLALYLMTCSHSTIAGAFRLPDGYVSEDLDWPIERVRQGLAELLSKGFANRCETTKWVWVVKHLEWNPPENPNQRKSAKKIAASIPSETCWIAEFMRVCGEVLAINTEEKANPSETVGEPFINQEQKQKQKQKEKTVPPADAADTAPPLTAKELVAEGVPLQHARDWLKVRKAKKAPLTLTAWEGVKAEALEAGITVADAVHFAALSNWQGFRAQWWRNATADGGKAGVAASAMEGAI